MLYAHVTFVIATSPITNTASKFDHNYSGDRWKNTHTTKPWCVWNMCVWAHIILKLLNRFWCLFVQPHHMKRKVTFFTIFLKAKMNWFKIDILLMKIMIRSSKMSHTGYVCKTYQKFFFTIKGCETLLKWKRELICWFI